VRRVPHHRRLELGAVLLLQASRARQQQVRQPPVPPEVVPARVAGQGGRCFGRALRR